MNGVGITFKVIVVVSIIAAIISLKLMGYVWTDAMVHLIVERNRRRIIGLLKDSEEYVQENQYYLDSRCCLRGIMF